MPVASVCRPIALLSVAVALVACSSADDVTDGTVGSSRPPATTTTPTPSTATTTTTTTAAPAVPRDYATPGPHAVGATTLALPDGAAVEVWYPTATAPTGTIGYDVRDRVPPAIRDLLTADVPAAVAVAGTRDADVAEGAHPLVVFSHGFAGVNVQSSLVTSHLASWGIVVAAPEHASRDLASTLVGTATGDRAAAVAEVLATLDLMTAEGATPGGRFDGHVDVERVALLGHSAGGSTVVAAATDARVDGYASMASGGPGDATPYPDVPSLFLAGATDAVVSATDVTRPAFEAAPSPSWYVELAATGHNGFDDFCTFGNGTGIVGIAEASGLGPLLEAQPQLRALGEDGCVPPAAPVEQALPTIRHATTAFLRHVLGLDADPALGPDLAAAGPLALVTARH